MPLIIPNSASTSPSTSTATSAIANSMVINTIGSATVIPISFYVGYTKPQQMLNSKKEGQLIQYIKHASQIYYGLSPQKVKKLAYNYAVDNIRVIHESWATKM